MNRKKARDTSATSPRPDLPRRGLPLSAPGQHPPHRGVDERAAGVPTAAPSMEILPNEEKIAEREAQPDEESSGNQRRTALAIAAASVAWPPRQNSQGQDVGRSADEEDDEDDENDDDEDDDQDISEPGATAGPAQGTSREAMQATLVGVGEGTAAGESTSGAPGDEAARAKREQRLAMNRISARERRKRKRLLIEQLQSSVMLLTRQNNELRERNTRLKEELIRLGGTLPPNIDAPTQVQTSSSSTAVLEGSTLPASASASTSRSEENKEEASRHLSEGQLKVESVSKGHDQAIGSSSSNVLGQGLPLSGLDLGSIAASYAGNPHLALLSRISGTHAGGTTNVTEALSRQQLQQEQREGLLESHGSTGGVTGEGALGAIEEQARMALMQQAASAASGAGGVQAGLPALSGMGEQNLNPVEMLARHLLLQERLKEQNSLSLLRSQRQGLSGSGGALGVAGDALQQRSMLQGAAAAAALGSTSLGTLAGSGTLGGFTPSQGAALLSAIAPATSAGVTGLDVGATQGVSSLLQQGGLSTNPNLSDLLSSLGGAASGAQLPSSSGENAALLALRNSGLLLPDALLAQQQRQNPSQSTPKSQDETDEARRKKMSGSRKDP